MKRLSIVLFAFILLASCKKTSQGAFPPQIGDFRLDHVTEMSDTEYFARYKSPAGYEIQYQLWEFKSPEEAKRELGRLKDIPLSTIADKVYFQTVQESDSRFVDVVEDETPKNVFIGETFGSRFILINAPNATAAIEFENNFPYTALGVSQPQKLTADEIKVIPVQVLAMLDEFNSDAKSANKRYNGKVLLMTGTVAGSGKSSSGAPFLAFQKPGTQPSARTNVGAAFDKSDETQVLAIQKGQPVTFSGKVSFDDRLGLGLLIIESCKLK